MSHANSRDVGQSRPLYKDLPINPIVNLPHAWDFWGPDDNLGTINSITPESVRRAAAEIRTGERINLSLPLTDPNPPFFGRNSYEHHFISIDRNTADDYVDGFYMQGSSQWDGLLHVRAREAGLFGGVQWDPKSGPRSARLGIEHWVEHGIVARGVLTDVKAFEESRGRSLAADAEHSITPAVLTEIAEEHSVDFQLGDILIVRTGWMAEYRRSDDQRRRQLVTDAPGVPGLAAGPSMAEFLWDAGFAAVVVDNPTFEVYPGSRENGSLHRRVIPMLGLAVGELWDFEALAEALAQQGRTTCCLVSVPLNIPGAVGSPANGLAIV